jgi:hypothetical protein
MVYAYLWGSADKLNWERSFAFFERLAKVTKPRAVRGYTPSQRLLAAGDFGLLHFGLFSRAFRDARDGAPVGVGAVEANDSQPRQYRDYEAFFGERDVDDPLCPPLNNNQPAVGSTKRFTATSGISKTLESPRGYL